jgi:hypothetical protein
MCKEMRGGEDNGYVEFTVAVTKRLGGMLGGAAELGAVKEATPGSSADSSGCSLFRAEPAKLAGAR